MSDEPEELGIPEGWWAKPPKLADPPQLRPEEPLRVLGKILLIPDSVKGVLGEAGFEDLVAKSGLTALSGPKELLDQIRVVG